MKCREERRKMKRLRVREDMTLIFQHRPDQVRPLFIVACHLSKYDAWREKQKRFEGKELISWRERKEEREYRRASKEGSRERAPKGLLYITSVMGEGL